MNIEIKNIKKGQVFYESEYGMTVRCTALDDAHFDEERNGHSVMAKCEMLSKGRVVGKPVDTEYFCTADPKWQYLGPDLSDSIDYF